MFQKKKTFTQLFRIIFIETDDSQYKIVQLNCTGEDSFKKNSFHPDSFVSNFDVRSLFGFNGAKFVNETMFDLNLAEDVLTIDGSIVEILFNKARYASDKAVVHGVVSLTERVLFQSEHTNPACFVP